MALSKVFCSVLILLGCLVVFEVYWTRLPTVHQEIVSLSYAMGDNASECQIKDPNLWKHFSEKRKKSTNHHSDEDWFIDSESDKVILFKGTEPNHKMIDVECCKSKLF